MQAWDIYPQDRSCNIHKLIQKQQEPQSCFEWSWHSYEASRSKSHMMVRVNWAEVARGQGYLAFFTAIRWSMEDG